MRGIVLRDDEGLVAGPTDEAKSQRLKDLEAEVARLRWQVSYLEAASRHPRPREAPYVNSVTSYYYINLIANTVTSYQPT